MITQGHPRSMTSYNYTIFTKNTQYKYIQYTQYTVTYLSFTTYRMLLKYTDMNKDYTVKQTDRQTD